ncbi:PqiC family protein [Aliidiomarina sp. Khilg15.8]
MRIPVFLLLFIALGACSAAPPSTERYLLSDPAFAAESQADEPEGLYAIGRIQLSSYLNGAGIVYKLDGNRIHEAQQHRWAEPLQGQLRRQLRLGLQQQLSRTTWLPFSGPRGQAADYQLDLQIDAFHITEDGDVSVGGHWQLRDHNQTLVGDGRFNQQRALMEDGYGAAVVALSQAWHASMADIAQGLTKAQINQ